MKKQCHILNGDALKDIFPASISGEQIIMRECLVDGSVAGDTLDGFFKTRAKYISETIPNVSKQDYFEQTVPELSKLLSIAQDTEINLWFEEDLFCQVNFWFCVHTLVNAGRWNNLYLVLPVKPNQYAFGYCSTDELEQFYKNRISIDNADLIAKLWTNYQSANFHEMRKVAEGLKEITCISRAVKAHIDRVPEDETKGLPYQTLKEIINELRTDEFAPVFKEFITRLPIYGYGDFQVQKLLKMIKNKPRK